MRREGGVLSAEECVVYILPNPLLQFSFIRVTSIIFLWTHGQLGVSGFLAAVYDSSEVRARGGTKQRIKQRWEKFLRLCGSGEQESVRHILASEKKKKAGLDSRVLTQWVELIQTQSTMFHLLQMMPEQGGELLWPLFVMKLQSEMFETVLNVITEGIMIPYAMYNRRWVQNISDIHKDSHEVYRHKEIKTGKEVAVPRNWTLLRYTRAVVKKKKKTAGEGGGNVLEWKTWNSEI